MVGRVEYLLFTALLLVVRWQGTLSAVNYIIARREETVDSICLGRDPRFAFDWDPAVTYTNLPASEYAQVVFTADGAITNANFLYIGSYTNLTGHFCASQVESLLFSPRIPGLFINLHNDPLPGSAGYISYVTPIWQASKWSKVSLKIVNLVNETWQLISTLEDDPVIDPNSTVSTQVLGNFFNATLGSFNMVQEYLARAAVDRAAYPLSTTCGAVLLSEEDGTTAYLFFAVFPGDSRMCVRDGEKPDPAMKNFTCVLAHVFEAQYDVNGVDFDSINSFFAGGYSSSRRRLLQLQHSEGYGGFSSRWRKSLGRQLLATSTGSSSSGGMQSMTCRIVPSRINSRCKVGLPTYPKCAWVCTTG